MVRHALAIIACLAIPASGFAQIQNPGFEDRGLIYPEAPIGWSLARGTSYNVALDSTVAYAGRMSVRSVLSAGSTPRLVVATQSLPISVARGKRLKVRVLIRTEAINEGVATMRLRVDGPRDATGAFYSLGNASLAGGGVRGTTPWTEHELEVAVDSMATRAYLDLHHVGGGTAWFDELQVEVDGVPLAPDAPAWSASEEQVEWLRTSALPLATDAPGSGIEDLQSLRPTIEGARIVGLGEGTHGTREFFRMKHRIIEWLVEREGVTVFGIEANMTEAQKLNRYVLSGVGDPREALEGLYFWTWNTEEVIELIEWMRRYNASGRGPVEFWGFDSQVATAAADSVLSFVLRRDPAFVPDLGRAYEGLRESEDERSLAPLRLSELFLKAQGVLSHLTANRARYLSDASVSEVDWGIQNARIVVQALEARADPNARDRNMAENVAWILERQPAGTRMVLWAHNGHVQQAARWMGGHLQRRFGDEYRSIGFAIGEGRYNAVGPNGLTAYRAAAPTPETLEYALRAVGQPLFAIDLRTARADPAAGWLSDPHLFRSQIGAGAREDRSNELPIGVYHDGLIYVDQSTPTRLIREPPN